jgi:hypothetical protein
VTSAAHLEAENAALRGVLAAVADSAPELWRDRAAGALAVVRAAIRPRGEATETLCVLRAAARVLREDATTADIREGNT